MGLTTEETRAEAESCGFVARCEAEEEITDKKTIKALRKCVGQIITKSALTQRQEQAVRLFRLYRRQVDVARMMGISKQAVHQLLRKAGEI